MQPLVLVGFVLLLVFGVHRALLKTPTPTTYASYWRQGGTEFLAPWVVMALVVIVLGFLFGFYQTHLKHDPDVQKRQAETTRLERLAAITKGFCQQPAKFEVDEAARRDAVKACVEAIHALAQANVPKQHKDVALARLDKGCATRQRDL